MEEYLSSGGSSKRGRTPSNVCCLVDGCKSDLSKCRDYHRRHKVCEMHSKTPKVSIGGNEQRFCQQCSRFHSLVEFDEGKRSCRKRLEGHNRRRRKPQPETLPMPMNHANFLSAGLGGNYVAFSKQSRIPGSSMVWSASGDGVKAESNPAVFNSSSHSYRGKQFPFLQCPPEADSPLMVNVDSTQKMFFNFNDVNQVMSSDRNRALSLLSSSSSSSPTPAEITDMGLGRIIHPSPFSTLHYNSVGRILEGGGSAFMRSSNSLCHEEDDSISGSSASASASGGHQTLSFSWE